MLITAACAASDCHPSPDHPRPQHILLASAQTHRQQLQEQLPRRQTQQLLRHCAQQLPSPHWLLLQGVTADCLMMLVQLSHPAPTVSMPYCSHVCVALQHWSRLYALKAAWYRWALLLDCYALPMTVHSHVQLGSQRWLQMGFGFFFAIVLACNTGIVAWANSSNCFA